MQAVLDSSRKCEGPRDTKIRLFHAYFLSQFCSAHLNYQALLMRKTRFSKDVSNDGMAWAKDPETNYCSRSPLGYPGVRSQTLRRFKQSECPRRVTSCKSKCIAELQRASRCRSRAIAGEAPDSCHSHIIDKLYLACRTVKSTYGPNYFPKVYRLPRN